MTVNLLKNLKLDNILDKINTPYYNKLIEVLERNRCVIEYIDSEELTNCLLAPKN